MIYLPAKQTSQRYIKGVVIGVKPTKYNNVFKDEQAHYVIVDTECMQAIGFSIVDGKLIPETNGTIKGLEVAYYSLDGFQVDNHINQLNERLQKGSLDTEPALGGNNE